LPQKQGTSLDEELRNPYDVEREDSLQNPYDLQSEDNLQNPYEVYGNKPEGGGQQPGYGASPYYGLGAGAQGQGHGY